MGAITVQSFSVQPPYSGEYAAEYDRMKCRYTCACLPAIYIHIHVAKRIDNPLMISKSGHSEVREAYLLETAFSK